MNKNNKLILFSIVISTIVVLVFISNSDKKNNHQKERKMSSVAKSDSINTNEDIPIDLSAISQHDESYYAKSFANVFIKGRLARDSINGEDALRLVYNPMPGYTYLIKWTKNGEPVGEGDTIRGFKRGDKIEVVIIPFKEGKELPKKVLPIMISNTAPIIKPHNELKYYDNVLVYQVRAHDADGDTLSYMLVESPKGATIDKDSGMLKWDVPPDSSGKVQFKIEISDGHGGKTLYPLEVTLSERK